MNETQKELQPKKPSDSPLKTGAVTDQAKIAELTESVERYTVFTQVTLEAEKRIRVLRGKLADNLFTNPEDGNDIQNWQPVVADEMASTLGAIASAYTTQASNLEHQMDALRRMNKAIIAIREEVLHGEG